MKVLLVQSVATDRGFIHLGLGFVAASLERSGHEVRILDLGIEGESRKAISQAIQKAAPDAVGITVLTPTWSSALRVAQTVKEADPKVPVILGGIHASVLTDEVLKEPAVDFVVRGEGEITMVKLLEAIEGRTDLSGVEGISYKSGGGIRHNPARALIENLDTIPPTPWHLFDLNQYSGKMHGKTAVGISAARGCPYNCVFCFRGPAAGKTIRSWSPARVVSELKTVTETYGIRTFHFWNDVFTYDKRWVEALCDRIVGEGLEIEWDCQTRADLINEDVLRKMKAAGCSSVMLGVESGSNDVLGFMEKGLTTDKIRDGFRLLQKIGFETTATFTLGLPWDTRETIRETIRFAKEINPDFAMFYIATPFPGSPLWNMCLEKGIPLSKNWDNYRILPFEVDIQNIYPVFDTSKLSVEDLRLYFKTAQIEFQLGRFRKGQILRSLKNIKVIFFMYYRRSKSIPNLLKFIGRISLDSLHFFRQKLFSFARKGP